MKLSSSELLRASTMFQNKTAQQMTAQPVDIQNALIKANLWGGKKEGEFDPNSSVAKTIFAIMDKSGFQGKIDATITVDKNLGVKINVTGSGQPLPPVINGIKSALEGKMSQALKTMKTPPPTDTITLGWLSQVG